MERMYVVMQMKEHENEPQVIFVGTEAEAKVKMFNLMERAIHNGYAIKSVDSEYGYRYRTTGDFAGDDGTMYKAKVEYFLQSF